MTYLLFKNNIFIQPNPLDQQNTLNSKEIKIEFTDE